jgi:hypothetical protein
MASKSKKLKKPEPVTVSVREYVAERTGTQRMERKITVKADFMMIRGGLSQRETRKRIVRFKERKGSQLK